MAKNGNIVSFVLLAGAILAQAIKCGAVQVRFTFDFQEQESLKSFKHFRVALSVIRQRLVSSGTVRSKRFEVQFLIDGKWKKMFLLTQGDRLRRVFMRVSEEGYEVYRQNYWKKWDLPENASLEWRTPNELLITLRAGMILVD